jgi:hypothetical protein
MRKGIVIAAVVIVSLLLCYFFFSGNFKVVLPSTITGTLGRLTSSTPDYQICIYYGIADQTYFVTTSGGYRVWLMNPSTSQGHTWVTSISAPSLIGTNVQVDGYYDDFYWRTGLLSDYDTKDVLIFTDFR